MGWNKRDAHAKSRPIGESRARQCYRLANRPFTAGRLDGRRFFFFAGFIIDPRQLSAPHWQT
jgi:hypothetical protein